MFQNSIQQVQQKLNSVQQIVNQVRYNEENSHQQLQRAQQLCQEAISNLQSVSFGQAGFAGTTQAPWTTTGTEFATYGVQPGTYTGYGVSPTMQSSYQATGLFNPTTLNPDSYQNLQQFVGTQGMGGAQSMGAGQAGFRPGQISGVAGGAAGYTTPFQTTSSLSNIATMSPDTYLASTQQLGKSSPTLSQIGQQAGISGGAFGAGSTMGMTGGVGAGGAASNLGQIGQQAKISTTVPGTNQGYNQ